jgi:hypothetical protein
MMANAAEARIRRCRLKIWGILSDSLVLGFQTVVRKVVIGRGFQRRV